MRKRPLDWDYFWATSRVIKDTINEYPFWSLLFADLHAHVLAIPIFLLFAAAALHLVRLHGEPVGSWGQRLWGAALLGFVARMPGADERVGRAAPRRAARSWSFRSTPALMPEAVASRASAGPERRCAARRGVRLPLRPAALVPAGGRPGHRQEPRAFLARRRSAHRVRPLLLPGARRGGSSSVGSRLADRGVRRAARWASGLILMAGLGFLAVRFPDVFLLAVRPALRGRVLLSRRGAGRPPGPRVPRDGVLPGPLRPALLHLRPDEHVLQAVPGGLAPLRDRHRRARLPRRASAAASIDRWAWPAKAAAALLALAALFTSATAGRAAVSRHFAPYSGPSLDGLRYLEEQRPGEYRAVEWLRRNVAGTPVVLEAQGPSYQDFGRISMLTGLPTVLGWDYHVKQRGNPESEIETPQGRRPHDLLEPDAGRALALLKRYRVGYVYVGPLERKTYPAGGLQKFRTKPDLFQLVYENPEAQIYRVVGSPTQDVLVPVKETLPESAAPGPPQDEPEEPPAMSEKPSARRALGQPPGAAGRGRRRAGPRLGRRLRQLAPPRLRSRTAAISAAGAGAARASSASASSAASRSAATRSTSPTPGTGASGRTRSTGSCAARPPSSTARAASPWPRTAASGSPTRATTASSPTARSSTTPADHRQEGQGPGRVLEPHRHRRVARRARSTSPTP